MLFCKYSLFFLASKRGESRRFGRKNLCIAISSLAFAGVVGQSMAQSGDASMLVEIIITAQKRAENMQDVPVAITAFSETMIDRSGANGLSDMEAAAPSLNFGRGSRATRGEITIRGVGGFSRNPGVDARASVYVDGVFVGRSAVFDQDLQGVTGVEILRGPQGTLFGKNTISGAININTKKPHEDFEGEVNLGLGNFDYTSISGRANIPLIEDKLYASVAATKLDRDGYIKNISLDRRISGIDRISGRAKLRFLASDDLEFNLSYDFLDEEDWGGNGEAITRDGPRGPTFSEAPKPREVSHDAQEREERDFWGMSLTADYDFGEDYTFTSITAYREAEWFNLNEEDYASANLGISVFDEKNEQFTQEFRITSPKDGAFDYVVGLFYIEQDIETSRNATLFGNFLATPVGVDTSGWAAYFHSNYRFTDELELTAGLRYTYEEKEIEFNMLNVGPDGNPPGLAGFLHLGDLVHKDDYDDDALTPKIGLNYHLNEETMLYASYSKGYKSGGHNVDYIRALEQLPYVAEEAESYEIGFKSTLFDGRARLNISAFMTEFTDFQVQQFQQVTPTVKTVSVSNAGEVTSEGVEAELIVMPIDGLTLTANVAYVDAAFDKFEECADGVDCDGHKLPYAPEWKTYLAAEYEFTVSDLGDAYIRFDYGYTDEYFTHASNDKQDHLNPHFEVFDGRIGLIASDENWEVAVWAKNLMDSDYTRMRELNFFDIPRGHYGAPRTYGIDLKYRIK